MNDFLIVMIIIYIAIQVVVTYLITKEVEENGAFSIVDGAPIYAYVMFFPAMILGAILGWVPFKRKR